MYQYIKSVSKTAKVLRVSSELNMDRQIDVVQIYLIPDPNLVMAGWGGVTSYTLVYCQSIIIIYILLYTVVSIVPPNMTHEQGVRQTAG